MSWRESKPPWVALCQTSRPPSGTAPRVSGAAPETNSLLSRWCYADGRAESRHCLTALSENELPGRASTAVEQVFFVLLSLRSAFFGYTLCHVPQLLSAAIYCQVDL